LIFFARSRLTNKGFENKSQTQTRNERPRDPFLNHCFLNIVYLLYCLHITIYIKQKHRTISYSSFCPLLFIFPIKGEVRTMVKQLDIHNYFRQSDIFHCYKQILCMSGGIRHNRYLNKNSINNKLCYIFNNN
jgi:hypothetical protein